MSTLALIGLGSNLGDRRAHLDAAIAALAETPGIAVRAISSYHATAPVGGPPGQGPFLNAAAALEMTLEPLDLLDRLQAIEARCGRTRVAHWGERTLDLDLLLFGDRVLETPRLRVPHPWLPFRRFVLASLAEVAPEAVDPLTGRTIAGLLAHLDRRPRYLALWTDPAGLSSPRSQAVLDAVERWGLPVARVAPPPDDRDHPRSALEFLRHALAPDRWAEDAVGDRWVVSPFWLDALMLVNPGPGPDASSSPEFRDRFLAVRAQVIPPTFVLARRGDRLRLSCLARSEHWPVPLGDTPVLEVDAIDPDAIAGQVLTACAAIRALEPAALL